MKKKKLYALQFKKITVSRAMGGHTGGAPVPTGNDPLPPLTWDCYSILICEHTNDCPNTAGCPSFAVVCDTMHPDDCFNVP